MSHAKHFIFKTHRLLTAVSGRRILLLNPLTDEEPEVRRYGLILQMFHSSAGTLLMSDWFQSLLLPASECWLSNNEHDDNNSNLSAYHRPDLCFLFKISSNLHGSPHFTYGKTEAQQRISHLLAQNLPAELELESKPSYMALASTQLLKPKTQ